MDISDLIKIINSSSSSPLNGYDYKTILFLDEVSQSDYDSAPEKWKRYKKGEIDGDYPIGSRPRKVSDAVFMQTPGVQEILIEKFVAGTAISDVLAAITSSWFCLVGLQGQAAIDAAGWVEMQKDKIQIIMEEDRDCWDISKNGTLARIKNLAYKKSFLNFHHQAGTILKNCKITVASGVATLQAASVAQVDHALITASVDNYVYTLGIGLDNISYTAILADTVDDIRTELIDNFNNNSTLSVIATASVHADLGKIAITANNLGEPFALTIASENMSQSGFTENSTKLHNRKIGDSLFIVGSIEADLNGVQIVTEVLENDQLKFNTIATSSDESGNITVDAGFEAPGGAVASTRLAYDLGTVDWYHHNIVGIETTDINILTTTLIDGLDSIHAGYFVELQLSSTISSGRRLMQGGKSASNNWITSILIGEIWYPLEMQRRILDYLTTQEKTGMTDGFLSGLWAFMNIFSEEARKKGLTAEFQKNLILYPETGGFPPGFKSGDHYVNRVPLVSSISSDDRQNHNISTGIETHFQTSGGIYGLTVYSKMAE